MFCRSEVPSIAGRRTGMYGSAALSQAKNDSEMLVRANVFGLFLTQKLLALMECAARSSYLVMQPSKAFPTILIQ